MGTSVVLSSLIKVWDLSLRDSINSDVAAEVVAFVVVVVVEEVEVEVDSVCCWCCDSIIGRNPGGAFDESPPPMGREVRAVVVGGVVAVVDVSNRGVAEIGNTIPRPRPRPTVPVA